MPYKYGPYHLRPRQQQQSFCQKGRFVACTAVTLQEQIVIVRLQAEIVYGCFTRLQCRLCELVNFRASRGARSGGGGAEGEVLVVVERGGGGAAGGEGRRG